MMTASLETLLGASALIPEREGATFSTTYVSGMAALGFLLEGQDAHAERILDTFAQRGNAACASCLADAQDDAATPANCAECGDPCPACTCNGGFQQFRTLSGGPLQACGSDPCIPVTGRNDYWIGDNAWLLSVLEYYAYSRRSARYDDLIFQLREWLRCIRAETPGVDGIHSGYDKNGNSRSGEQPHAEGNIDVYGALQRAALLDGTVDAVRKADIAALRRSVKTWLEANVWDRSRGGSCPSRGRDNTLNLPTDHVAWGTLALMPEDPFYACLPDVHGSATARSLDLSFIDIFDRPRDDASDYWRLGRSAPGPVVTAATQTQNRTLRIDYDWNRGADLAPYAQVTRRQGIRLKVSEQFALRFGVRSNAQNPGGLGPELEITFADANCQYWPRIRLGSSPEVPLNGLATVMYDTLNAPMRRVPATCGDLSGTEVREIRFALNPADDSSLPEQGFVEIGPLVYADSPVPGVLDGFAGLEADEPSRIFVEGTASMAAAYCAANTCEDPRYAIYMNELAELMPATLHPTGEQGLPSDVRLGANRWSPGAASAAWMILAAHCFNPFAPESPQ